MLKRVDGCCCQHADLAHAAARYFTPAQGLCNKVARAAKHRADGCAQPFAQADRYAVKVAGNVARGKVGVGACFWCGYGGVEQARAVQVGSQPVLARQCGGLLQVLQGHGKAVPGVFKAEQAGAGEVAVIGFDGGFDISERHLPLGVLCEWLRLYTAEHGCAPAFVAVGVCELPYDVFIAAPAVCEQGAQIALCAAGHEQGCFFASDGGNALLQCIDGGVVTKYIVAYGCRQHDFAHGGGGLGDGVAA